MNGAGTNVTGANRPEMSADALNDRRFNRYAPWAALVVAAAFLAGSFLATGIVALNAPLTVAFWGFVPGCALVVWVTPNRMRPSDMIAASVAAGLITGWVATVGRFVASDWSFRAVAVASIVALLGRLAVPPRYGSEETPRSGTAR